MKNFRDFIDNFIIKPAANLSFLKLFLTRKAAVILLILPIFIFILIAGIKITSSLFIDNNVAEVPVKNEKDTLTIEIDMSDYLIPEHITARKEFSWQAYRGVKEKWSQEDIDEFWIKPEITVRETASEKNSRHIDELFESIP